MKIDIDARPMKAHETKPFFALRLFPETNEEMGNMEWGMEVAGKPVSISRVMNGSGDKTFHYVITFEKKEN